MKTTFFGFVYQRQSERVVEGIFWVSVMILLFLFEFVGLMNWPRAHWEQYLLNPALERIARLITEVERPFYMIGNARRATRRVQDLELRYSEVLAQLGELQALEDENAALRQLLENTNRRLTDSVITKPIVSFAEPAVAVGTADGVRPGSLIMISQSLVGVVTAVTDQTARVDLLYRDKSHPIVARTESGVEGVIVGDGRRLRLTEITRTAEVTIGERVVTTGQPGVPPDLFLGLVVEIDQGQADPVKEVVVEQLADFYKTTIVEVIKQ